MEERKDKVNVGRFPNEDVADYSSRKGTPVNDQLHQAPLPTPPMPEPPKPPAEGVRRILIGVPTVSISYEFMKSFLAFWTEIVRAEEPNLEVGYQIVYRKPVQIAETLIVDVALFNKCTHVLFMDDDIYDVNFSMLKMLLDADKDVISGVMYASSFPYAMCTFRRFDEKVPVADMPRITSMYRLYEIPCLCPRCKAPQPGWAAKFCANCGLEHKNLAVQRVDLIPFCFTLIKTSVFERIKKPWFHCNEVFPTDSWFADRCIEAGIEEYAHMLVRLNHRGINDITRPHYFNMGMAETQAKRRVVFLTPEQMTAHKAMVESKMLEAERRSKIESSPKFVGAQ